MSCAAGTNGCLDLRRRAFALKLRLKKAEAGKERCVRQESRTTLENPGKTLEQSHHSENVSRAFQRTSNCI